VGDVTLQEIEARVHHLYGKYDQNIYESTLGSISNILNASFQITLPFPGIPYGSLSLSGLP
jgi:hypothetical protein